MFLITSEELRDEFLILDPESYFKSNGYEYHKVNDIYCIYSKLKFKNKRDIEIILDSYCDMIYEEDFDRVISIIKEIYYSDVDISISDRKYQREIIESMLDDKVLILDKVNYTLTVNNKLLIMVLDI